MYRKIMSVLILSLAAMMVAPVQAAEAQAPAELQAALIIKLLPMYTNLENKDFTIHVVGAPEVAAKLKSSLGKSVGKAKLANVTASDSLPGGNVDVIYVGSNADAGINFSKSNKILSISGNIDYVKKGVTLGLGLENNKPKIYLNLNASKANEINWNPAILKVAKTIG